MTGSLLESFDSLRPLTGLPQLTCIYLEHSPVAQLPTYKETVLAMLPTLTQVSPPSSSLLCKHLVAYEADQMSSIFAVLAGCRRCAKEVNK